MNDPNYFDALGLHQDPFGSGPASDLWSGLEALSLEVLHTVEFVAPVAVVIGAGGTGKTSLATELAERLENSGETLSLSAGELSSENQLLKVIADFLDLPVDPNARAGELLVQIRSAMTEGQLYLLLDDSDLLGDESLAPLMSLLQSSRELPPIRIVLLTTKDISSRLDGYGMPDVAVQDFHIPLIELPEAARVLQQRVEQAGYGGKPLFDEALIEPWWEEASGDFNRLFDQAKEWLREEALNAQEPGEDSARQTPRLPVVHVVAVAALIAGLGMVYLYSGDSNEEAANVGIAKAVEGGVSLQIPPERKEVAELSVDQSKSPRLDGAIAQDAQNGTTPNVEDSLPGGRDSSLYGDSKSSTSNEMDDSIPPTTDRKAASESEASLTLSVEGSDLKDDGPSTQPPEPGGSEILVQQTAIGGDSVLGATKDSEVKAPVRPESVNYQFDELEILSWPQSDYTLQVLGVSSEASARRYIDVQANKSQLVLYFTERGGKPWFVVLAGRYATRPDAKAAISGLPDRQQKANPWIRSVQDIQDSIDQ